MPRLTACARSANVVAAALRPLGFELTERQDPSTGGIDGGISEFTDHLAKATGTASAGAGSKGAGLIYVCGYAADFNDRTFLLPTTARIERPSDLLTQGVLAKTLLTAVSHSPDTTAVVVFDLVPEPGATAKLALDVLTGLPAPDGVAVLAASETGLTDAPTPLAAALAAELAGPVVTTDRLLSDVRTRLTGGAVGISAHSPVRPGYLIGAPVQAPAPAAAAPPTPASGAQTPAVPAVAAPAAPLPDEAHMTEADRRTVQGALVRLGYYDLPVDGVFGPETRAAMRRYQHEIGAEMTGHLTADQATRLVGTR